MSDEVKLEVINGVSKKSGNAYKALKLTIGDWSQLIFTRSAFEMNYVEELLARQPKASA